MFRDMAGAVANKSHSTNEPAANGDAKSSFPAQDLSEAWDIFNTCISQCNVDNHAVEDIAPCVPYQAELMKASHEFGAWMFHAVFEVGEGSLERAKETVDIVRRRTPAFRTRIIQHETGLYQVVVKDEIRWIQTDDPLEVYKARDLSRRLWSGSEPGYCALAGRLSVLTY
jgi:hypothetical protein